MKKKRHVDFQPTNFHKFPAVKEWYPTSHLGDELWNFMYGNVYSVEKMCQTVYLSDDT